MTSEDTQPKKDILTRDKHIKRYSMIICHQRNANLSNNELPLQTY